MSGNQSIEAVQQEYARLAADYDARWSGYVRASVRQVCSRLPRGEGMRLLDVGCGTGVLLEAVLARHPEWECVGVDLSRPMLQRARARLRGRARLVCASAGALPVRAASMDVVASSSSLHFWPDAAAGIREIRRVLRPGGRLVLVDWSADAWTTRLLTAGLRLMRRPLGRVLGAREMAALLSESGFQRVEVGTFRAGVWGMWAASADRTGPAAEE